MWREFNAFLVKQNVIALAIAFIIGVATSELVQALVSDFIMPVIEAVSPADDWEAATLTVGKVEFLVGHFLAALLNFAIILAVAWQLSKSFIRPNAEARPATRNCPYCRQSIDAEASRCAFCTSQLAAAG